MAMKGKAEPKGPAVVRTPGPKGQLLGGLTSDEWNANTAAVAWLQLYQRERNGLFVWRAFLEFRIRGLAVPEVILGKFEEWARGLMKASGPKEIAQAIEMTGVRGGAQGASQMKIVERRWRIASEVYTLLDVMTREDGTPMLGKIYASVAVRHRTSAGNVARIYREWVTPPKVLALCRE